MREIISYNWFESCSSRMFHHFSFCLANITLHRLHDTIIFYKNNWTPVSFSILMPWFKPSQQKITTLHPFPVSYPKRCSRAPKFTIYVLPVSLLSQLAFSSENDDCWKAAPIKTQPVACTANWKVVCLDTSIKHLFDLVLAN